MNWRELLGFTPTVEDLAKQLLKRSPSSGWTFMPEELQLRDANGGVMNLGNMHREYASAPRRARPALLEKYSQIMEQVRLEAPKLWSIAKQNIYPVVRSIYARMTLEIMSRDGSAKFPSAVTWPLAGEFLIQLVFDHGQSMAHVEERLAETWGQSRDELLKQALANLRALERPRWNLVDDGVYQIESEVSYEESFMLVEPVIEALGFGDRVVLIPVNRGVLLACDGANGDAVVRMLQRADHSLRENPWPLGATVLTPRNGVWIEASLTGLASEWKQRLERISLSGTYGDQQAALQKHLGDDTYVASYSLMGRSDGVHSVTSWCSWTEGVRALLPETDVVVFGRGVGTPEQLMLLVPWAKVKEICGRYLLPQNENPIRFLVESFPTGEEWKQLEAVAMNN